MSGSLINEDSIVKLAGVIRGKNGLRTTYRPQDMPQAILDLNTDGEIEIDPIAIQIMNNTITTLDDSENQAIKTLGSYALYKCARLSKIDLPVCTSVGAYALSGCTNLTTINIPRVTSVLDYGFDGCNNIVSLGDGIRINSINSYGFRGCSRLTEFKTTGGGTIYQGAFKDCAALTSVDFGGYCSFYDCFRGCTNLESITLRFQKYTCQWYNYNSILTQLADTKILTTGHIYVPEELIDQYRVALGWSDVASRLAVIPPPDIPDDPEGGT